MSDGTSQQSAGTKESGAAAPDPKRPELDARAAELGVQEPDKLRTKEDVEEAIRDAEAVPRFSTDEILANARTLTGYSRHLVTGALHGAEQDAFTKAEITKLAKDFAEHEAETEDEA